MIALLDTSEDLDVCRAELGCPVEQLLTPASMFKRQYPRRKFSVDNSAFAGFKSGPFKALLLREKDAKALCRFVVVPDVPFNARRTLEVFDSWKYRLTGWPLALVAQDGIEDLPIPWDNITTLFIGGTTKFKLSDTAKQLIQSAKAMYKPKWVHVGRVNAPGRFEMFDELGVDSIDGQGLSQYTHMREAIWKAKNQPNLLTDLVPTADTSSPQLVTGKPIAEIADAITAESTSVAEG